MEKMRSFLSKRDKAGHKSDRQRVTMQIVQELCKRPGLDRTGLAIETQGFSFVTSGLRRENLTGNATLHLYPLSTTLQEMPGVVDYLFTEISTSKQKKVPPVTFMDSFGLVDGDMCHPFDVNEAVLRLAELCDMVLVFFPIGRAF